MILDCHTHIWASVDQLGAELAQRIRGRQAEHWGQYDATPAAHERTMGCVDGAIVLGFRSERLGASIPNELIADYVAKDPRRMIGVAGIDPLADDANDQLDKAIDLGLSGVAVAPASQGFHPSHSAAMHVYERCVELSMPLFVMGTDPIAPSSELEFARPTLWDEVAREYPKLPIVISQLGSPWIDETLTLLAKHEHLWADISAVANRPWQLYTALLNASGYKVLDKLLFGSGFPFETPAKAIEAIYSVNAFSHGSQLPTVPRSQLRAMVERDVIACLGLEATIEPRVTRKAQPGRIEPKKGEAATSPALAEVAAGEAGAEPGPPGSPTPPDAVTNGRREKRGDESDGRPDDE